MTSVVAAESLVDQRVRVGDRVRVIQNGAHTRQNTSERFQVTFEDELEVTRVYSNTLMVRTVAARAVNGSYRDIGYQRVSFSIPRWQLTMWDPNAPRPPEPRKLGKKPEDTEEQTFVAVNDPGIQWLFDDMGAFAEAQGYCSQYDALCAKLGIPGRPREFSVTHAVNGIEVTARIRARSQREANEIVRAALDPNVTQTPEPEQPTPDFAASA